MTPEQLLYTAVGTLAGAVVFLFGLVMKKNAAQDKRIEDCEADRARLNVEVMKQKDHIIEILKSLSAAGIRPIKNGDTPL